MQISLAPIQGITDYHFRNTFQRFFDGVDVFYSPYLRLDNNKQLLKSKVKDIHPENNVGVHLVPQIMSNNAHDFLYLSNYLADLGYKMVNWNLGCPFPMVTNRELGSGLLPHYNKINDILEKVIPVIKTGVSVKMRIGLDNTDDIFNILPILNKFPITEIIIHPRTGKQMYKGEIHTDVFEKSLSLSNHSISYNGDINTLGDYIKLNSRFKTVNSFMIGRGLVANPFLAEQIKQLDKNPSKSKIERFKEFHHALTDEYLKTLSGPSHLINRMAAFWEYFAQSFSNSHKVYKRIKKATSIDKYWAAVEVNCKEESWVA